MVGWVKRARPSRGCKDEAANYEAMPPWSISNQCLSRTEQLAGLVRDEFFHGLNAGEDAQHERLRRHGKAQVAERQEEDCRRGGGRRPTERVRTIVHCERLWKVVGFLSRTIIELSQSMAQMVTGNGTSNALLVH